jgi:hypothetical protein
MFQSVKPSDEVPNDQVAKSVSITSRKDRFGSSPGLRARRTQAERPPKSFACALRNSAAVREANELLQRHPFVARAIAADCACSQHSSRSATSLRSNILCQTTRR